MRFAPAWRLQWGAACSPQHPQGWQPSEAALGLRCEPHGRGAGHLPSLGEEGDARLCLKMPHSSILQHRREAGIAITTATIV